MQMMSWTAARTSRLAGEECRSMRKSLKGALNIPGSCFAGDRSRLLASLGPTMESPRGLTVGIVRSEATAARQATSSISLMHWLQL